MESTVAGAGKKRKEAVGLLAKKLDEASESGDGGILEKKEGDSLFEEGEMLRLREEFWEAEELWRRSFVEGTLDRWLESKKKTLPPAVGKKRKVIRLPVHDAYIHFIMENPTLMRELSDEEMADCPERERQMYAIQKVINAKNLAYQKALIDQYKTFGFAYDEKEVTEEEEVVVNN